MPERPERLKYWRRNLLYVAILLVVWFIVSFGFGILLVDGEFAVETVHPPHVHEDEQNEDVDRALLREPEAELEAAEADLVEAIHEQDAEAVRDDEPHREQEGDVTDVPPPVFDSVAAIIHGAARGTGSRVYGQTRSGVEVLRSKTP